MGELYLVGHTRGEIRRVVSVAPPADLVLWIDTPRAGALVQPFVMAGWALDLAQTGAATGVDTVHLWAVPLDGRAPVFLGASYGRPRPDVAAAFGSRYEDSGYAITVSGLPAGDYQLAAFAHSTVTGRFETSRAVVASIVRGQIIAIDHPAAGAVSARFTIEGWAADFDSPSGTGVDAVHVWAYPTAGAPRFVGAATYGLNRPDLGITFGSRFAPAGWALTGAGLPPGAWTLVAFLHSSTSGTFSQATVVPVQVPSGVRLAVETPAAGSVPTTFLVAGWALDLAATSGAGIGAIHVWAFPVGGGAPLPAGVGTLGVARPDVGGVFGAQFTPSGYQLSVSSLPAGSYDLVVYAQSQVTGTFDAAGVVRIAVAAAR